MGDEEKFPLLVKFIDAKESLSVQVHPDDDFARENENGELGKTEMWYIMDASHGAGILYGFKEEITKDEFKESIENNTLLDYTYFAKCKKGDSFFIPAGTLHAIGEGILIAEIQQNSDTTYRVYDYNRKDANGNTRELHIEKAKSAIKHFSSKEINDLCFSRPDDQDGILCACEYFSVFKITSEKNISKAISNKNSSLTFLTDGSFTLDGRSFEGYAGDTFYIPPGDGKTDLIISAEEAVLTVF